MIAVGIFSWLFFGSRHCIEGRLQLSWVCRHEPTPLHILPDGYPHDFSKARENKAEANVRVKEQTGQLEGGM